MNFSVLSFITVPSIPSLCNYSNNRLVLTSLHTINLKFTLKIFFTKFIFSVVLPIISNFVNFIFTFPGMQAIKRIRSNGFISYWCSYYGDLPHIHLGLFYSNYEQSSLVISYRYFSLLLFIFFFSFALNLGFSLRGIPS